MESHMDVSENRGKKTKMDGEKWKALSFNGWFGGVSLFSETPISFLPQMPSLRSHIFARDDCCMPSCPKRFCVLVNFSATAFQGFPPPWPKPKKNTSSKKNPTDPGPINGSYHLVEFYGKSRWNMFGETGSYGYFFLVFQVQRDMLSHIDPIKNQRFMEGKYTILIGPSWAVYLGNSPILKYTTPTVRKRTAIRRHEEPENRGSQKP